MTLFATSGNEGLFLVLMIAGGIIYATFKIVQWQNERELREQDPKAYLELKKLQHERERMRHQRKQAAMNIGSFITRILFGRYFK